MLSRVRLVLFTASSGGRTAHDMSERPKIADNCDKHMCLSISLQVYIVDVHMYLYEFMYVSVSLTSIHSECTGNDQ